ncbi:hypothetical protein [Streptomyces noursei]|nr:hypothetical protein [Streptomyces noursei]MCZ1019834.1 hypothetical protein [Streptomyces noursei]
MAIDHFALLETDPHGARLLHPEQAAELGRRLSLILSGILKFPGELG